MTITQYKSKNGSDQRQLDTLRSLGLHRIGEVVEVEDNPQTRGMIGAAELDAMRDDAWLVNVGRGGLVDTDALVAALREERIGGAALDPDLVALLDHNKALAGLEAKFLAAGLELAFAEDQRSGERGGCHDAADSRDHRLALHRAAAGKAGDGA